MTCLFGQFYNVTESASLSRLAMSNTMVEAGVRQYMEAGGYECVGNPLHFPMLLAGRWNWWSLPGERTSAKLNDIIQTEDVRKALFSFDHDMASRMTWWYASFFDEFANFFIFPHVLHVVLGLTDPMDELHATSIFMPEFGTRKVVLSNMPLAPQTKIIRPSIASPDSGVRLFDASMSYFALFGETSSLPQEVTVEWSKPLGLFLAHEFPWLRRIKYSKCELLEAVAICPEN